MDTYDLQKDLLLYEVYDHINSRLLGYGIKAVANDKYSRIYFGEGVELFLSKNGDKVEFTWKTSLINLYKQELRGIIVYLLIFFILLIGYLFTNYVWSDYFLLIIFSVLIIIDVLILLFKIPISIISSKIHFMKTQILLMEILDKYKQ